jgi:hypothetical protein
VQPVRLRVALDKCTGRGRTSDESKIVDAPSFHERCHDLATRARKDVDDTRREVLCVHGQGRKVRGCAIAWDT